MDTGSAPRTETPPNRAHRGPHISHDSNEDRELLPLLGVDDVSGILGIPKATLYRWHSMSNAGDRVGPPAFRVGRYLRYSLKDLARYIDDLRHGIS